MAQNQNSSNSEGVCKKIYNAISNSPTICCISCQPSPPRASISTTSQPNPQAQTIKTGPPQTKPVDTVHQTSQNKKIPAEVEPPSAPVSAHKNKNATNFTAKMHSAGKEHNTAKREIPIANGQGNDHKAAKSASRKELDLPCGHAEKGASKEDKPSVHVSAPMTKSSKDDGLMHQKREEGMKMERTRTKDKFSDYGRKVKDNNRTVSNAGAGRTATRRDSFNDKVSNYIHRTKLKIRTMTNLGDDKGVSSK